MSCKCGNRTLADAHGQGACWRCYTELLEDKNVLVKENQTLRAEIESLKKQVNFLTGPF